MVSRHQPTRKTHRRPIIGITDAAERFAKVAPEIELGWIALRGLLRDAGWPSRTPEDDRHDRVRREGTIRPGEEPSALDYHDPTGDLATARINQLHADLDELQDLRARFEHCAIRMAALAQRYRDEMTPAVPLCSVPGCDEIVEMNHTGRASYRGMEQIAGVWVPKPGVAPACARHGRSSRRENAA